MGATVCSVLLLFSLVLVPCLQGEEVMWNGDAESLDNWRCYKIYCELTTNHRCGSRSVKVANRKKANEGPSNSFSARPNAVYAAKAFAKLLHGVQGQTFQIVIDFHFTDDSHYYSTVAERPVSRAADDWIPLEGFFRAPHRDLKSARLKIQGPDPNVEFLVDCVSVNRILNADGWRKISDQVIHDKRQSDININVTIPETMNISDVEIQVLQKDRSFPLGTAVNEWSFHIEKYRNFILKHFNWAVHEGSLKWARVEPWEGGYNYDLPLRVLDDLRNNGLKVRGHTLLWSTEDSVPGWVKQLSGDRLKSAVAHHIKEIMERTRGRLEHWDVINEELNGHWYTNRLQDFRYDEEVFRIAHTTDPDVKLFLNDFNIVAHGTTTGAFIEQARRIQNASVGLYGLGVQCHFWPDEYPDPDLIKARLDALAETGLPVWVTEFNVWAVDENKRADFVEKAMRAFFGHPAVEGILIWGFWDKSISRGPNAALFKGDDMQPNAAGRRFLDLWENHWMTDETRVLSQTGLSFTVRGFHGNYEVNIRYQGQELSSLKQTFTLGSSSHNVDVNILLPD